MSETRAVPLDVLKGADRSGLTGQPLCPACVVGRLHPYRVVIDLSTVPGGFHGAHYLTGWVATCVGNRDHLSAKAVLYAEAETDDPDPQQEVPPCGFSMPMTPSLVRP